MYSSGKWLKSVPRNEQRLQQVAYYSLTCVSVKMWNVFLKCEGIVHNLLTLMPFQTCMTFSLLWDTKEDILQNVGLTLSSSVLFFLFYSWFHALLMQYLALSLSLSLLVVPLLRCWVVHSNPLLTAALPLGPSDSRALAALCTSPQHH